MNNPIFYLAGGSPAMAHAGRELEYRGCAVAEDPSENVTHLLLPVPSFQENGRIRGSGSLQEILDAVSKNVTVFGGNLELPALSSYITEDFLKDPRYLAENAAITAHCALAIAMEQLPITWQDCPVLIIGWGRIGKCLAALLKALDANVTIAARKETDRAMAHALGCGAVNTDGLSFGLMRYRAIFNTVPSPVLDEEQMSYCRCDAVKIDLASVRGMAGEGVIWARGLPGKMAPEASGKLIARTAIRLARGKEREI